MPKQEQPEVLPEPEQEHVDAIVASFERGLDTFGPLSQIGGKEAQIVLRSGFHHGAGAHVEVDVETGVPVGGAPSSNQNICRIELHIAMDSESDTDSDEERPDTDVLFNVFAIRDTEPLSAQALANLRAAQQRYNEEHKKGDMEQLKEE